MGLFQPIAPFIANPYGSSNPNASNPLSPTTSATLAARPSGSAATVSAPGVPGQMTTSQWDEYLKTIKEAYAASSGWAREQLAAQLADAQKGRDNAYKIAELQSQTSRYGTDQQTMVQLRQLEQNQRQFEANHGLEIAKAVASYSSTPDMMWARNDLVAALGRTGQGQASMSIYEGQQPKAKGYEDFAALATYGGGSGMSTANASGAGANGTDPRVKAARAVMDAIPPSATPGNDGQDWAALEAIRNLFSAGKPGSVERLGASRAKTAYAGMARLGYDPNLVQEEYKRGLPGQGSSRAA